MTTPKVLADELLRFYAETRSWRKVGDAIGMSAAYAWKVAKGKLVASQSACDMWDYFKTGQETRYAWAACCPSCGVVHGAGLDCHNEPFERVVLLRPGERVVSDVPQPPPIERKNSSGWRDLPPAELARAFRERRVYCP